MSLNGKDVFALVPARGGSKGLKRKNMLEVCGVPLVNYTLRSALDSKYVDEVYLSSDDENTLSYGQKLGVNVVKRPIEYSSDTATAASVVKHFLSGITVDLIENDPYILYLQPTSPMRTSKHIDDALQKMVENNSERLISVNEMRKSPFKAFVLNKDGRLETLFDDEKTNHRRQDLPIVYLPNGAIYVFSVSDFESNNRFPTNGSFPYVMSEEDSLDIDTMKDLEEFQQLVSKRNI